MIAQRHPRMCGWRRDVRGCGCVKGREYGEAACRVCRDPTGSAAHALGRPVHLHNANGLGFKQAKRVRLGATGCRTSNRDVLRLPVAAAPMSPGPRWCCPSRACLCARRRVVRRLSFGVGGRDAAQRRARRRPNHTTRSCRMWVWVWGWVGECEWARARGHGEDETRPSSLTLGPPSRGRCISG